jgi:hypothetical protein
MYALALLLLYSNQADDLTSALDNLQDNGYSHILSALKTDARLTNVAMLKGYNSIAYELQQLQNIFVESQVLVYAFFSGKLPDPVADAFALDVPACLSQSGSPSLTARHPPPSPLQPSPVPLLAKSTTSSTHPSRLLPLKPITPPTDPSRNKSSLLGLETNPPPDTPPRFRLHLSLLLPPSCLNQSLLLHPNPPPSLRPHPPTHLSNLFSQSVSLSCLHTFLLLHPRPALLLSLPLPTSSLSSPPTPYSP